MPDQKQSLILGSAIVAVLSTSYLGIINCLCCAGVIAGAMVSVWHYTTNNELTISAGSGASMGAIVGLVGTLIAMILNLALVKMGVRSDLAVTNFIINQFGDSIPPDSLDQMIEQANSPVTIVSYIKSAWVGLIVGPLFGAIGGIIGASVFKNGTDDLAVAE